jgi:hypothetical protein
VSEFTEARGCEPLVGDTFQLGDDETGEEQYKVISANRLTKEVVVESTGKNKKRYTVKPKESLPQKTKGEGSTPRSRSDNSPFLQKK